MIESSLPILSLVIFFPLIALVGLIGLRDDRSARYYAAGMALAEVLLASLVLVLFDFDSNRMQLMERAAWIPHLNIAYVVGVDGLSVVFPLLTAWINLALIVAGWTPLQHRVRPCLALLFLLESVTIGGFCALDLVLFFLFQALSLIPVFFLISLYGTGPARRPAAVKYTLLMLAGGMALLTGFLLLAFNHAEQLGIPLSRGLSFDYLTLLHIPLAEPVKSLVFLLLLTGFAVRAPVFPFHGWLPTLALEGPAGLTAWLTGLNLGVYGILRIAIPLIPGAAREYDRLLMGLGIIGLLYGGLIALRQDNLRALLAWSGISQVGSTLMGIATLTTQGVQGALFQLMNFSMVSTGLFLMAGFIRHRTGTTDLPSLRGMVTVMPRLTFLLLILGLSSLGVPGTGGFAAGLLILTGAFQTHPGPGLALLLGTVLSAGYFFTVCRQAFSGSPWPDHLIEERDLRPREMLVAGSFVIMTLLSGLMPNLLTDITRKSVAVWISRVNHTPDDTTYAQRRPEADHHGQNDTTLTGLVQPNMASLPGRTQSIDQKQNSKRDHPS